MKLVSTLQNHQGSNPSILLFFSFFWRCTASTARTPFDSRRTVYLQVTTQIPRRREVRYLHDLRCDNQPYYSERTSHRLGVRGRCNTLGPEQWIWRSADKSPRIHFRLARLASSHDLGRENIYVRCLSTIAQNLLLANARDSFAEAGALAEREITI